MIEENEESMHIISVDMGWRHLSFVRMRLQKNEHFEIYEWKVLDVLTEDFGNVNDSTIENLVNAATPKIFELAHSWIKDNVDIVFLEQQPMGLMSKNIKTKILSHIFQSLLVSQNMKVKFISPKKKLLGLGMEDRSYAENKKYAVSCTEDLLKKHGKTEMLNFFINHKGKKDDLADSFLQGFYGGLQYMIEKNKKKRTTTTKKRKIIDKNIKNEF